MTFKDTVVQMFEEQQLVVNITEHAVRARRDLLSALIFIVRTQLVPQHTPLLEEEKQELLDRYKLKETQVA